MDCDSLPPPPPSSPLPAAPGDEQLMAQTRTIVAINCRRARAPTATSGPTPEPTPRDDVVATRTRVPKSPGSCHFSDAQPPLAAHDSCQATSESEFGPRGLTYTPVSLSRDLGSSVWDPSLQKLPAEIMLHILGYLDVCDLLPTSRVSTEQPAWRYPNTGRNPLPLSPIRLDSTPPTSHLLTMITCSYTLLTRLSGCRHVTTCGISARTQFYTNTASGALGSPSLHY